MSKARTLLLIGLSLSFSSTGFADWQTEGFVGLTADLYKDEAQMGQCCDTLANRALIAPRLLWWNDSGWAATFSPYAEYEFQSEQGSSICAKPISLMREKRSNGCLAMVWFTGVLRKSTNPST